MNRNVKILGRGLYSPSLKDLSWLEDIWLIFLIFHTFVCKFGWADAVRGKNSVLTIVWEMKLTERLLAQLHPSNLVNAAIHKLCKIQHFFK